jgi:hypothetical protein
MAVENRTKTMSQQLREEFTQAALKGDRTNITHRTIFLSIFDEWQDDAGLPSAWKRRRQQNSVAT